MGKIEGEMMYFLIQVHQSNLANEKRKNNFFKKTNIYTQRVYSLLNLAHLKKNVR